MQKKKKVIVVEKNDTKTINLKKKKLLNDLTFISVFTQCVCTDEWINSRYVVESSRWRKFLENIRFDRKKKKKTIKINERFSRS